MTSVPRKQKGSEFYPFLIGAIETRQSLIYKECDRLQNSHGRLRTVSLLSQNKDA